MSREYSEKMPLQGSTIAQFQSRAVKTFATLGWKLENFTKIGVSATIPKKSKNDNHDGKFDLSFVGEECEISCSLAKSPTMFVSRPAKENAALFLKQFDKEAADPSAESADAHEKAMTNALMEANRFEQERLAAKAAREAKIKRIKLIFRCVVPLACGALGLVTNGFSGLWTGIFIGRIVNEVLIFLWKLFWNVPWC